MTRERTHTWSDPHVLARLAGELDGIEFLNQIGRGDLPLPPVSSTTGIMPVEAGDGWAVFEMEPAEWHFNPIGSVHGGIISTIADSALGCAVQTRLPAGIGYTSLDLTIKFTRAANLDSGLLRCRGEVVTIGRRTATAEATVIDAKGRTVAHAITTCLLFPLPTATSNPQPAQQEGMNS
ncbi:PaaI family thioesterase [Nocardia neocaledoniensis]|uniref:PaaI family thioesterase n=1 Tax=Nocardia neocaledoniensis TaxID=236511 RepID=UPI002455E615|nr:PaaI family thioesterase [Nocardia neocaledoniensis]